MKTLLLFLFGVSMVFIPLLTHLKLTPDPYPPLYALDIIIAMMLCCSIFLSMSNRYFSGWRSIYEKCFTIFMFWFFVSTMMSLIFGNPIAEATYLMMRQGLAVSGFVIAFVIIQISPSSFIKFARLFVCASATMVILGMGVQRGWFFSMFIVEQLGPFYKALEKTQEHLAYGDMRLMWGMGSTTSTGGLLALSCVINFYLIFSKAVSKTALSNAILIVAFFINVYGLIHTLTRHAWIAALLAIIFCIARNGVFSVLRIGFLIAGSFVGIAISGFMSYSSQQMDGASRVQQEGFASRLAFDNLATESRFGRVLTALSAAVEKPQFFVFGSGPGVTSLADKIETETAGAKIAAHNFPITAIRNWGLTGAVTFGILFVLVAWGLYRRTNSSTNPDIEVVAECVLLFPVTFACIMLVDHYLISVPAMEFLLWAFTGFGAGILYMDNSRHAPTQFYRSRYSNDWNAQRP